MPVYEYTAKNNKGIKIKGNVEAGDILAARQVIYQKKLYLLNIKIKHISRFAQWMTFLNTINNRDLILITRQMSILVNAAIPLDEALALIENQSTKSKVDRVIHKIRKRILEGHSLSDSLSQFPAIFNSLYRSMIAAGELSGHLGLVLSNLADHIEQARKVKSKITQTLIYPAILVSVSIGVIAILLTLIIPNIIEQFVSYDKVLPLSTRVLMVTSHWIENNILSIIIFLVIFLFSLYGVSKIRKVNRFIEFFYLKLPIFGSLIFKLNISRYMRMMEILSSNGVNLIRAMDISTSVVTNLYIKQRLDDAVILVSEGGSLSSSLSNSRIFSPMTIHMIASGERSGKLDDILKKITDIQEQEIIEEINVFVILLEPVIMISMASFIFFIVLAIFQPILEMNNLIF
ncbi:type II secretion system F family protein [Yersinia enterocolitica]|uniref:type II secretion system F family protein n=1 Tax=Yersinia enterocolitica TaxID=630 RepID=UPI0005DF47C5|nr:type II secretion system F family protein [Yersinia enterocolitica]EKN3385195.1 type II secretion system F family protein [Yersinia enterocolitica]EKN3584739.1 type II secretion system F family protein [Yersinia enterocolitica]EKN3755563.1 type II secretion system F family protein [Yersinia enterocolitica]EKN3765227.1 type II secretion system F family protein [Yersinia enterocolitica]EKN3796246.1 type II secretion system F family protein [Yersinia enterocolitica]